MGKVYDANVKIVLISVFCFSVIFYKCHLDKHTYFQYKQTLYSNIISKTTPNSHSKVGSSRVNLPLRKYPRSCLWRGWPWTQRRLPLPHHAGCDLLTPRRRTGSRKAPHYQPSSPSASGGGQKWTVDSLLLRSCQITFLFSSGLCFSGFFA